MYSKNIKLNVFSLTQSKLVKLLNLGPVFQWSDIQSDSIYFTVNVKLGFPMLRHLLF